MKLIFALAGLIAFSPASGQEIDPEALRRHIAVLASDAFEGRMPGTPGEAKTIAYISAEMGKAGLEPAAAPGRWYQPVNVGGVWSQNVIGRIAGTDPAAGAVVVTAHWDHLGICRSEGAADRICNGAVDNASGVAELIELGRLLVAGPRMARTILLIATTGEERGLLGSKAFVRDPVVPLASIVAAINFDCVAVAPRDEPIGVIGRGKTVLDPLIDAVAREAGRAVDDDRGANGYLSRQDGWSFLKAGIPAVMAGSAFGDLGPLHRFMDKRYHRPSDQDASALELGGAAQDGAFLAAFVRALADPVRFPGTR